MAFIKRTWLARIGTGLNKFIIGEKDANDKQTLVNSPDSVSQQGDVISAENLNDLEDRIDEGFNGKQDVLTFDNVPTQNSNNPVKSGGLYTVIEGMKLTKIWENPNPTSPYPATDPTAHISIGDVKDFSIEYSAYYSSPLYRMIRIRALSTADSGQRTMYHVAVGAQYVIVASRYIQIGSTGSSLEISFSDCQEWRSDTNAITTNNNRLIPVAIYAVGDIYTT